MSWRDGGELLPRLVMPAVIEVELRKELARIESASTPVNCMILQAGTEALVKALELLKALSASDVERLYVLIENVATARMLELEQ